MSHHDYRMSGEILEHGGQYGFYALLMAAMRHADLCNQHRLEGAFPEVWAELNARYAAPGGYLAGEGPRAGEGPS